MPPQPLQSTRSFRLPATRTFSLALLSCLIHGVTVSRDPAMTPPASRGYSEVMVPVLRWKDVGDPDSAWRPGNMSHRAQDLKMTLLPIHPLSYPERGGQILASVTAPSLTVS